MNKLICLIVFGCFLYIYIYIDRATINTHPSSMTVHAGTSNINLFCGATGIPIPTITWLKDGQPVNTTEPRIIVSEPILLYLPNQAMAEFGLVHSTLTIQDLSLEDDGMYVCEAVNTGAPGTIFNDTSNEASIIVQCKQ